MLAINSGLERRVAEPTGELGRCLGLAISMRPVTMMNGTIEVRSAVGRGSVFNVVLPIERIEGARTPAGSTLEGVTCIVDCAHRSGIRAASGVY